MKKFMSDKGTSFDITKVREGESDCKNGKVDTRYMWKTLRNGWKTMVWALYYMKRRDNSCTIRVFFLKRETLFSTFLSYQLSTPFSKDLLRFLPWKVQLHVPLIIWGIWLSMKTGVKSSFSYFWTFP